MTAKIIIKSYSVGLILKKLREDTGISQSDLARGLGFRSPASISQFESSARRVKIETLEMYSKFFTVLFIVGGDA